MNKIQHRRIVHTLDSMLAVCREHQTYPGQNDKPGDYLNNVATTILLCQERLPAAPDLLSVTDMLWAVLRKPLFQAPTLPEDHQNWAVAQLQVLLDSMAAAFLPLKEG